LTLDVSGILIYKVVDNGVVWTLIYHVVFHSLGFEAQLIHERLFCLLGLEVSFLCIFGINIFLDLRLSELVRISKGRLWHLSCTYISGEFGVSSRWHLLLILSSIRSILWALTLLFLVVALAHATLNVLTILDFVFNLRWIYIRPAHFAVLVGHLEG
jgi:hypothetical protein